jgi:hypothetical protein
MDVVPDFLGYRIERDDLSSFSPRVQVWHLSHNGFRSWIQHELNRGRHGVVGGAPSPQKQLEAELARAM